MTEHSPEFYSGDEGEVSSDGDGTAGTIPNQSSPGA